MKRLEGKVALVTGAARGIGKGIAIKLAEEGAYVINADISQEQSFLVAQEIVASGGRAMGCKVNIADKASVQALFATVEEKVGNLNILVNNAGINRDATLHKMSDEQWDAVISVNLTGTFYMMREAAKRMREYEDGRIINIASMSWMGNFGQANYAASKAGIVGMTRTATRELARKGITCNAICPGFIDTDMTRGVPSKVWDAMIAKIPAGHAGTARDVGNLVAFLASDEASYINGQVIDVSGGMVL